MKNLFLKMSFILISVGALFTSCVQGDLYDLYEEDGTELMSPRKKCSKDMPGFFDEPKYACGIHCISYVSRKTCRDVQKAANSVGLGSQADHTGAELIRIASAVEGASFSGYVQCETTDAQHRQALIDKLNSFGGSSVSILVLINTHWVVGTEVKMKENKKTGVVNYWVNTFDPQDNSSNSYDTNDTCIRCVVY